MNRIFAVGALALAACAGLDTGNAQTATVQLALVVGPGSPVDSSGVEFGLTKTIANVSHIDLYLPVGTSCAKLSGLATAEADNTITCQGDKIRARGPWRIDLLSHVVTPPLPVVPVVAGSYTRIDVRFEKDAKGLTMSVGGTVPFAGTPTPYAMNLAFDEDLRFEGAPVVADTTAVAKALLALDPTGWFATQPITQCVTDGDIDVVDGIIQLQDGDTDCVDLESVVRDAVSASGSLRPGTDGDFDGDDRP